MVGVHVANNEQDEVVDCVCDVVRFWLTLNLEVGDAVDDAVLLPVQLSVCVRLSLTIGLRVNVSIDVGFAVGSAGVGNAIAVQVSRVPPGDGGSRSLIPSIANNVRCC